MDAFDRTVRVLSLLEAELLVIGFIQRKIANDEPLTIREKQYYDWWKLSRMVPSRAGLKRIVL